MSTLKQDVRYIVRLLQRQPVMTAIIVMSLALGIGANTMIFSLVNQFLLQPLPFPDSDRLSIVWFQPPNAPNGRASGTRENCMAIRERQQVFESVGCMVGQAANVGDDQRAGVEPELLQGQWLTADLPQVIGVNPLLGRWFTREEERALTPVVVISYELWQQRFGAAPDILGKKIRLDSTTYDIIGIMPKDFAILNNQVKWWAPFQNPPFAARGPNRILLIMARLKPGGTIPQAQAEMDTLATALAEERPQTNRNWKIRVVNMERDLAAGATAPLLTFQGAVLIVLLIACANVAGLLLAQGAAQQKELAVRSALGSSRWRIVRQMLTESVLLALVGGAIGSMIGWAGLRLFMSYLPPGFPSVGMDLRVLGFTLILSIATGLLFGILPALQVSRPDLMDALRENSRSATATKTRQKLRSAFVVVQVSLALVLLIGAGLLMKSFLNLSNLPVGFDYANLTTFQIVFPLGDYLRETGETTPSGARAMELTPRINQTSEQIRERLAAIPGVEAATATLTAPFFGVRSYNFTIEGRETPAPNAQGGGAQGPSAQWYPVMTGYFNTIGMPIVRGRVLGPQDGAATPPVAVINSTMAKRYWPNDDPIGKRIKLDYYNDQMREIVGIVGDVKQNIREREPQAQMYVPYAQLPVIQESQTAIGLQSVTFVVRAGGDLGAVVPGMRSAARQVLPSLAVANVRTVAEYAYFQLLDQWIYSTLLTIFGAIAVVLAIGGIYGVMAHSVTQRTSEIGVRVALGASARDVLRLILRRGVLLIAFGILIGAGLSFALNRAIQSVLWGVTPTDPMTYVLALGAMAGVALLACYIPARRALRIDPVIALRTD